MGIESYLLAGVLRCVSAQRLLRRICHNCRRPTAVGLADQAFLERLAQSATNLWQGGGCKECHQTGFKGRLAIGELFEVNETVEQLIVAHESKSALAAHYRQLGVPFLMEAGLSAVLSGQSTVAELERAVLLTT